LAELCKIKITDPALAKVLGGSEFDSYEDFESAISPGDELLVSDRQGHFIAKFRKFAFSHIGRLKVLYDSPRGEAQIEEILGKATAALLQENEANLDAGAKSRLVVIPADVPPSSPQEQANAIYDPEDSKVKMEQFESTTGQDVKSEFDGTLDERPSTLPKMALRQAVSENPQKYRFFVVADSSSYFNDEGIEPTGEVLLVVHAAAYESLLAEKGRPLTGEELNTVAVRMIGETIAGEGTIYTLPLEGSLSGEAQFFERNHEERVQAYAGKYGVTEAQAEAHFRAGEARLKDARQRARTAPVEVGLQSVSMGSYVNDQQEIDDFVKSNKLTPIGFFKNTSKGKVMGRVYFRATTPDGRIIEMLTVPKGVREMYGDQFLWDTYRSGASPEFLSSLFGNFYRPNGPYMKNGVLFSGKAPIETLDDFTAALNQTDWPVLSNKVDGGLATVYENGEFIQIPNNEFIKMHTVTDGNLWKHNGRPVPYAANRYLYLNVSGSKPVERVVSQDEHLERATQDLFRDPREYDRIASSTDPKDVAVKMMLPNLFSPAFLKSQSYPRLRKRLKPAPPQKGSIAINYPVGGRYFGSKAVARRKLAEVITAYQQGGLPVDSFEEVEARILNAVIQAQQEGIELGTFEPEANALYTHFTNEFVAGIESQILYGQRQDINGVFPEIAPSWWNAQPEGTTQTTAITGFPQAPSPVLTALENEQPLITYDAYRTISKANGSWTEAQETEYQDHIADPSKKVEKAVEMAYSGPMNTKLDGNGAVQSFEQINLPVRKFTLVGSDSEIGRQMLSEGHSIATPEGKTMFAPYFYSPREAQEDERFLQDLEQAPNNPVERTPAYEYAEMLLGKNFAQKLFSSGQPYTFADIEAFRADLGKPFSFTRFNARKDFAIYPRSEAKIASGSKTITLRDSSADYANRSGLVEIDGEVFDIQEVGNITLRKALEMTGMTQQEFAKQFLGEDSGIESIREESVKAFFDGDGTKRVFTIKKLGEPVDPRKRKSKKQMPC
jgi:uncharacterized protein YqfB (UPF0267 family)